MLVRGLHLGSLQDCPTCLWLCGLVPLEALYTSGMGKNACWRHKCEELMQILANWYGKLATQARSMLATIRETAEAGKSWPQDDRHPWEKFVRLVHGLFLVVPRTR